MITDATYTSIALIENPDFSLVLAFLLTDFIGPTILVNLCIIVIASYHVAIVIIFIQNNYKIIIIIMIIGCSVAYKMSDYPQYQGLNSQLVEQRNSTLHKIKSSLSYMNKENFLLHCSFYLWYWNHKKWNLNLINQSSLFVKVDNLFISK